MAKRGKHREQIVAGVRRSLKDIEQYFVDVASWNDNARKPGEEPIDPDPTGDMGKIRDGYRAFLKAEDSRPLPPILPAGFVRPSMRVQ